MYLYVQIHYYNVMIFLIFLSIGILTSLIYMRLQTNTYKDITVSNNTY